MTNPRQGEVWWADLPAPFKRRPVLVLTRTDAIKHMHQVTVAPVTRTIRGIDAEVVLTPEHGVPTLSAISLDNIQTVRKETLNQRVTVLDQETMQEVFNAICFVFAMPGSAV